VFSLQEVTGGLSGERSGVVHPLELLRIDLLVSILITQKPPALMMPWGILTTFGGERQLDLAA